MAVEHLAGIPGVVAVTLGGSRATNTAVEGSDWDLGSYHRVACLANLCQAMLAAAQGRLTDDV